GPITIVSAPKRHDPVVVNGISCMACHARGVIPKNDEVRAYVEANRLAFSEEDRKTIFKLYPPAEDFNDSLQGDAELFAAAVKRTGAPFSTTDPVVELALRYEEDVDLNLAAAEVGVKPEDFLKALDRSPRLTGLFGTLNVAGGSVDRQVLVDGF